MPDVQVDVQVDADPPEPSAPLRLRPVLVEKPWGGRRLAAPGTPDGVLVGESWDVADLDPSLTSVADPASRVLAGPYRAHTLGELAAAHPAWVLGEAAPTAHGRFPLLVKHLDARQHLSVQVHPTAEVAARRPGCHLKTESWVVVDAEPGAELFLGVVDGVTPADVEAAAGTPALVPMLRRVPARAGDVHHLPAGLLHALGAGVVAVEAQTPSDTTFRLYDWAAEYGRAPRGSDVEAGMDSLRSAWDVNLAPPDPVVGDGVVVVTDHYRVSRTSVPHAAARDVVIDPRAAPRVVVVLDGLVDVSGDAAGPLAAGGVVVLPAGWSGSLRAAPGAAWLDVDVVPRRRAGTARSRRRVLAAAPA